MQKMSQLQHSRKRGLLDGFAQAFQGTVEQLKQVIDLFSIAKTRTRNIPFMKMICRLFINNTHILPVVGHRTIMKA